MSPSGLMAQAELSWGLVSPWPLELMGPLELTVMMLARKMMLAVLAGIGASGLSLTLFRLVVLLMKTLLFGFSDYIGSIRKNMKY